MNILAEPFSVPKRGSREDENDDAVWPQERLEYKEPIARFAIADGATVSLYSGRWAALLVSAVGDNRLSPNCIYEELPALRAEAQEWTAGKSLPWYLEEKARQGAFAALVALELTDAESGDGSTGPWQAAAVGDSCVFHTRGEEVLARFPLENSDAFGNRPFLLGSIGSEEETLPTRISYRDGIWARGDVFYLMTDALACWFLHQVEAGGRPSVVPGDLVVTNGTVVFRAWVESLRDQGLIRNDDCTLLRIYLR